MEQFFATKGIGFSFCFKNISEGFLTDGISLQRFVNIDPLDYQQVSE